VGVGEGVEEGVEDPPTRYIGHFLAGPNERDLGACTQMCGVGWGLKVCWCWCESRWKRLACAGWPGAMVGSLVHRWWRGQDPAGTSWRGRLRARGFFFIRPGRLRLKIGPASPQNQVSPGFASTSGLDGFASKPGQPQLRLNIRPGRLRLKTRSAPASPQHQAWPASPQNQVSPGFASKASGFASKTCQPYAPDPPPTAAYGAQGTRRDTSGLKPKRKVCPAKRATPWRGRP
jgi:hypothetical protein